VEQFSSSSRPASSDLQSQTSNPRSALQSQPMTPGALPHAVSGVPAAAAGVPAAAVGASANGRTLLWADEFEPCTAAGCAGGAGALGALGRWGRWDGGTSSLTGSLTSNLASLVPPPPPTIGAPMAASRRLTGASTSATALPRPSTSPAGAAPAVRGLACVLVGGWGVGWGGGGSGRGLGHPHQVTHGVSGGTLGPTPTSQPRGSEHARWRGGGALVGLHMECCGAHGGNPITRPGATMSSS
jgi:hypothetical protein